MPSVVQTQYGIMIYPWHVFWTGYSEDIMQDNLDATEKHFRIKPPKPREELSMKSN